MLREGQIVLFPFPLADLSRGRLRPALVLRELPGKHDDWLICMISSQLHHCIADFDEILGPDDPGFVTTGLRARSVIRLSRLAVVSQSSLVGSVGCVDEERLGRLRAKLCRWIGGV